MTYQVQRKLAASTMHKPDSSTPNDWSVEFGGTEDGKSFAINMQFGAGLNQATAEKIADRVLKALNEE